MPADKGEAAHRREPAAKAGRAPGGRAGDLRARDPRPEADVLLAHPGSRAGGGNRSGGAFQQPDPLPGRARAATGRRWWRLPTCTAAASASSIFWRRPSPPGDPGPLERGPQDCRPACWISSSTAPISPTSCCATRSCWRRSAGRWIWAATAGRRRRAAPFLPPPDAAHPEREHAGARADFRDAGPDFGAGRQRDRSGLPHRHGRSARRPRTPPTSRATR